MIAVVDGGVKESNAALFGSGQFVLKRRMTIDCQRNRFGSDAFFIFCDMRSRVC